jgi:filamentous hemagglutinin family protein
MVQVVGACVRKLSGWRLIRWDALAIVALAMLAVPRGAAAQPAPNARPEGGVVAAGSASIGNSANTTTIDQASARAAIRWQNFDLGASETVMVLAPSASAVTLMRVASPDPSQIAGRIESNGAVIITNQSGAYLYPGSQMDLAGMVISAPGVSNANFMAGKLIFDQAVSPNANVVTRGTIAAAQAVSVALLAPAVSNTGTITAKLGLVQLLGAKAATINPYGDGPSNIDVAGDDTQAPDGPNGKLAPALVSQTGVIRAPGGVVSMTAGAADGIVQDLVADSGQVVAKTLGARTGNVQIGGVGGSITVDGNVTAMGGAGESGGTIALLPSATVSLGPDARVNVSGATGGGTIAIGTTTARAVGGPSVPSAETSANVSVASGAIVAANATGDGNGGHISALSTIATDFGGTASVRGGPNGGNGGLIELSSSGTLDLGGADLNTGAPLGSPGTILLDPRRLVW